MTPAEIRSQLQRILASQRFVSSPQLGSFLNHVVEETLSGRADQIKQYTIAVKALGYGSDFDPLTNSIVRMQARRLRRALQHYYTHAGETDPVRITIPIGTYVPAFVSNNPSENRVGRSDPMHRGAQSAPPLNPPARQPIDRYRPSIAVLPFLNLNDPGENTHFATVLAEEIVILLTRFADLRVIGALSRERIQHDGADIQQIGKEYNIRFVVDGTIQWNDGSVCVRTKVLDTQARDHIWVQKYQRNRSGQSLAEIIETVGTEVAIAIGAAYSPIWQRIIQEARRQPANYLSALEVSLRSCYYIDNSSPAGYRRAIETLEQAVALEPYSAAALVYLGSLYVDAYALLYRDDIPAEALKYLRRALRLDPLNARIQFFFAYAAYYLGDMHGFRQAASRSLGLNPHATTTGDLGLLYVLAGEEAYGLALVEQVMQQHPHYPSHFHYAPMLIHARRGDYVAALAEVRKVHLATPWNWLLYAVLFAHANELEEAERAVTELLALRPDFVERSPELMSRVFSNADMDWLSVGLKKTSLFARHASAADKQ